ncbi:hypothetical protein AB1Y20_003303 [Prymnesium parvum]|uniref:histone deacetylase n=1 Tax=Prymnesium parvum TaxID=97485 RepID=A0AB34JBJ7_PRYPA
MKRSSDGALLFCEAAVEHHSPWKSIEKPSRVLSAHEHLRRCGLLRQCTVLTAPSASEAELREVHSQRHIDEVVRLSAAVGDDPHNRTLAEPDGRGGVYYTAAADEAARRACGCVLEASRAVLQPGARIRRAFALVRPPGHHAGYDDTEGHRAEGFCFYNSAAVAAACVLRSGLAAKVAILDWDVHHGNGTQRLFYGRQDVLYLSIHRMGRGYYPQTGHNDEVGEGDGVGLNVNIGWPGDGLGDADYMAAMELVVIPVLLSFAPDLLIISSGFDAAEGDVQGRMNVTPKGFGDMMCRVQQHVCCPIVASLEGGYCEPVLSLCCEHVLRALLGMERDCSQRRQAMHKLTEPTLREVIHIQQAHWPSLRTQEERTHNYFLAAQQDSKPTRSSSRVRKAWPVDSSAASKKRHQKKASSSPKASSAAR